MSVGAAHEWGNLALMTSADITVLPTDEVCRLLGIEERRLKQLIRDRVLIEARADHGVRGVPQDVLVKGANGWEPLKSRLRGCMPNRTNWVSAPSTRSRLAATIASTASLRRWPSERRPPQWLGVRRAWR